MEEMSFSSPKRRLMEAKERDQYFEKEVSASTVIPCIDLNSFSL